MGASFLAYYIKQFKFEDIENLVDKLNEASKFPVLRLESTSYGRKDYEEFCFFNCSQKSARDKFEQDNYILVDLNNAGSLSFTKNLICFNSYYKWNSCLEYKSRRIELRNICWELSKNLEIGPAVYISETYDFTETFVGNSFDEFILILESNLGKPEKIDSFLSEGSLLEKARQYDKPLYFIDDFSVDIS